MPSSPPTLLPFGSSTASVIYSNTRYLLGVIRSIMTSSPTGEQQQRLAAKHRALGLSDSVFQFPPQDMDDSICSPDPTPLDIGLLSTDTTSLDGALARTTDLVANSIRTFLKQFNPYAPSKNDVRVLVFGSHSLARAKYLSQTKDFPNLHYPVSSSPSLDSPSHGGLFYADHIAELDECDAHTFDAIITFNLSTRNEHETATLIDRLQSILRPGGCLAGTGLFHGLESENDLASITSHDTHLSVRTFRSLVETVGFFMHTSIDVSLEGNVILQVVDERMDQDVNDVLEQLRIGRLLCVRFLATKHAPMGASTPRHAQIMAVATDATPILTSTPLTDNIDDLSSIASPADGVVVTGVSLGLPSAAHEGRRVFDPTNFDALFDGMQFIQQMSDGDKQAMIDQNVFSITKIDGKRVKYKLSKPNEMIQVCSKIGTFDLAKEYGIPAHIVECLDTTYALAIAAGLEALKDAGIVLSDDGHGTSMGLPEHMRDETGVIFASSFPCIDSCIEEVTACIAAKIRAELSETPTTSTYEYNRKLLFKFLVMANCQLAEMIRARGPNTHINSACAGTTQAVSLAEDWIRAGRCRRVIVIAADNATSEHLLPYIATGFLALGAASTAPTVDTAAVPFDARRKGMILGAGAVGLVIESTHTALSRNITPKVEILGSHLANSAYHASLMYGPHISSELAVFMKKMELQHGLDRATLARDCIYYSHETGTSVCARIEMDALLASFGDARRDIIIANTKGFTGHPMGVGIEEAMAVQSLHTGRIPPIANYKCPDPSLGDLYLSTGENHTRNYAIRFAAGFGSHFVYVLYKKWGQQS